MRGELTAAAALLPRHPVPFLRLANISFGQSDYEQALNYPKEAIEANATQVWGWVWKGRALSQLGRSTEVALFSTAGRSRLSCARQIPNEERASPITLQ